jgi:hypothetical protein
MNIEEIIIDWEYAQACTMETNINKHLPVLRRLAEECNVIVELGLCYGWSTRAFLAAKPERLFSVEKARIRPELLSLQKIVHNTDWKIINKGSLQIKPIACDLLLFDTVHRYAHLKAELEIHAESARKGLIFHDTYTFGHKGEGRGMGILKAIDEYIAKNNCWKKVYDTTDNNGLQVYERIVDE